ncbi:MAG TPA: Mov34/MPN/PAD-1 family protein [Chloroflexia bacterium]|nr:Mov34/MPN/PAD-1 family protein [Chloroflexia bacterium]
MLKLVTHNIYEGGELPPFPSNVFYEFWLAEGGVYLRAKRTGLEVLMAVSRCEVRGLSDLQPFVKLEYPPIPQELVAQTLELSRQAKNERNRPVEKLFHLSFDERAWRWRLEVPEQVQTAGSVKPVDSGAGSSYERAVLELHSHHSMSAFFSPTDDMDEARSFRLFAVIGRIFQRAEIRVRVGVFGYFWQIDPELVLEMPAGLHDSSKLEDEETRYDFFKEVYYDSTRA